MGLRDHRFVIIDTETTGNDTSKDLPLEVAVLLWRNGKPHDIKSWLIDPGIPIHPAASAVHGLSDIDVQGKETLEDINAELQEFVGEDSTLVAHNAPFDFAMLPKLQDRRWIDSLRLARHTWTLGEKNHNGHELGSHKQQEIRFWLGLNIDTGGLMAHRAAADILVTGNLMQLVIDKYLAAGNEDSIEAFERFALSPVQWPRYPWGQHKNKEFSELPMKFIGYQLERFNETGDGDEDLINILRKEQARRIVEENTGGGHSLFARSKPRR
jgi:DNA polymerase III epsilon subunit-like protein